ncbi:MAG: hypothetical protein NTX23_09465 [Candidatus Bipolaricaulota bacterium]|nr:hypothetical protein [Candidatus Bipolaricaulota bacterium]
MQVHGPAAYLVQTFAIFLSVAGTYVLVWISRKPFYEAFGAARRTGTLLPLWCLYLILPMLFSLSGVGLISVSSPDIQEAVRQIHAGPDSVTVDLGWASILALGSMLLATLSVALARILAVVFDLKGVLEATYFAAVSSLAVLGVMAYTEPHYVEVLFEKVMSLSFIVQLLVVGSLVGLLTEVLVSNLPRPAK